MELARTKIIIRLEKNVWVDGHYHYSDMDRETALLPIAEEIAQVVDTLLKSKHPNIRFVVRVKRGSHKAKVVKGA